MFVTRFVDRGNEWWAFYVLLVGSQQALNQHVIVMNQTFKTYKRHIPNYGKNRANPNKAAYDCSRSGQAYQAS